MLRHEAGDLLGKCHTELRQNLPASPQRHGHTLPDRCPHVLLVITDRGVEPGDRRDIGKGTAGAPGTLLGVMQSAGDAAVRGEATDDHAIRRLAGYLQYSRPSPCDDDRDTAHRSEVEMPGAEAHHLAVERDVALTAGEAIDQLDGFADRPGRAYAVDAELLEPG